MDALAQYDTINSKKENMLLVNDRDSEIITISTYTNLQYLCNETKDIFMDGTFKCCPKHFLQLYTIHGCKNGTYIPLVYPLLPSKTEQCYRSMWSLLLRRSTEKILIFDLRLYILTLSALCTVLCQLSILILALIVADSISVSVGGGIFRPWD